MDITLEIGKKYNLTMKKLPSSSNIQVVIPNAKFHAVDYEKNTPVMVFHYGVCYGTPQSITLMSGHIESVEEVDTEASSE